MATLQSPSNNLSALINAGADAMTNLYYVQFTGGVFDTLQSAATVRASKITLPTFTQGTSERGFMTVKVNMPSPSYTGEKQFSVTFRVDSNYKLYNELLKQQSKVYAPSLGYAANEISSEDFFTTKVFVPNKGVNSSLSGLESPEDNTFLGSDNDNYTEAYVFNNCWITSISGLSFSYEDSGVQNVDVTIKFLSFEDPQYKKLKSTK